ncbi:MAG: choice-of-anchor B family protein [Gemmatimonadetes bacterium]|nr:choice-of-anchor B family protein [Gemmatimonadota bacterium]
MRIRQSHVNPLLVLAACCLIVPMPVAAQAFGGAVLVADGRVYVGEAAHERDPGTVRVYADDGEWTVIATLRAPEPQVRDGFGTALARTGELLLVGADGIDGGKVYAYRLDDVQREDARPVQVLDGPGLSGFGASLAAVGDDLVVGATNEAGRVLATFRRASGGQWSSSGTVGVAGPAGPGGGRWFDLAEDRLVVGDPGADAVRVFERGASGTGWEEVAVVNAPESDAPRAMPFGANVVPFAGEILVGQMTVEMGDDGNASLAGVVHRLGRVDGEWTAVGTVWPEDTAARGAFGMSMATDGTSLLVGGGPQLFVFGRSEAAPADGSAPFALEHTVDVFEPVAGNVVTISNQTLAFAGSIAVLGNPGADFGLGSATVFSGASGEWTRSAVLTVDYAGLPAISGGEVACADGGAAGYDCDHVDLLSFVPWAELGAGRGARLNDVWGWTDALDDREYALVGRMDGTAFVDVTDPYNPRYLGNLAMTEGSRANSWRDMKVFRDHAFVVADGAGQHGMQIFDLTQLRDVTEPREFEATAMYTGIASSHNIAINEETGFAYLVGSSDGGETCGGGSHMVDINDPLNPVFAGCFAHPNTGRRNTGNSHDTQCVIYHGPDEDYAGREICVNSNETALSIADVTDKDNPIAVAAADYPNVAYAHQGWLTEDHRYFYSNDELDEVGGLVDATRTLIWDLADLDDPLLLSEYMNPTRATDHNMYVKGDRLYMSNNRAGLRVLDISDPENPIELGFFDTTPWSADEAGFDGTWSVYPYFESGSVLLSSRREGLFIVRPRARRLIP